jgi:hypothetical protein
VHILQKKDPVKILTLFAMGLIIGLAGCNLQYPPRVKGSGIVKTEKRSLASFDSLDVNCFGSIQVHSQGQESLEISGDDNIVPLITTEVENGTLYIRSSKGYNPHDKLEIIVSTPDLKRFVFDGAGEANLSNIKNDRLEIVLSAVGSLSVSGETKEADITLSGVGSLDAKNLHAVNAKVNSSGVGSVDIYATGQLDVKASGVGEVNYYGNPKILNRQAEGIGTINER